MTEEFNEAEVDSLFSEFEDGNVGESDYETAGAKCPAFTPVAVENPGGGRIKDKKIPGSSDIVTVKGAFHPKVPLHRRAAAALAALVCAARADGIKSPLLLPTGSRSGFRDPKQQTEAWQRALKKYGSPEKASKWVAKPGSSAHQSGRAIDFYLGASNSSGNVAKLRKTRAYQWMVANASRFGFYPYKSEPWHWEYNPPAAGQPELFFEDEDRFEFEDMFEAEIESGEYLEVGRQPPIAAPALIRSESAPAAQTLYVKIPLGDEKPAKPMTGIYVPQNFQPHPHLDLIVYLHGIKPRADLAIDRYWNTKYFQYWPLRERLNASQKNVILVAPTLGPRSQGQTGWLTKPGGLDKYLEKALAALAAHGPYRNAAPQIRTIILACHSGGGRPMRELALAQNKCAPKIKECWGFDCTYFDDDLTGWPRWARARSGSKLYLYYRPNSQTQPRARKIQSLKIANVVVLTSPVGHNSVPIKHWQERLQAAAFLQPTKSASTGRELSSWPSQPETARGDSGAYESESEDFEAFDTELEDREDYESEGEDSEVLDTELADEEWEDEFRRFRGMAGRAPRPRMRIAPRRRPPQRPTRRLQRPTRPTPRSARPTLRPTQRPQRPLTRLQRRVRRRGWPIDSIQEPTRTARAERLSEYVRWVQASLNQVLRLRLPLTGVMNAATRSALRTFQRQRNLPVDGFAGSATRKALIEAKKKLFGRAGQPSRSRRSQRPRSSPPSDEPGLSAPSDEPSSAAPSDEPSPSEPSDEPSSAAPGDEPASAAPSDEPSPSEPTDEPSSAAPDGEPSSSAPGDEPSSSAPSQEPATPEEFEWFGEDEFEGADEAYDVFTERGEVGSSKAPAGGPDIVRVRGIKVARRIAPKVEALLAAAQADGIRLGGWGYRSRDKQIELRKRHCGPTHYDIYQKPSSQCMPPTATPGKSMHEKGLAIDITHNGKTIKSRRSPAFQWMSRNAGRFGLFNLPSEPWHWSVNGK